MFVIDAIEGNGAIIGRREVQQSASETFNISFATSRHLKDLIVTEFSRDERGPAHRPDPYVKVSTEITCTFPGEQGTG